MTVLVSVLLFLALTFEDEFFAVGHWNTVMVHLSPLFHGNPVKVWDVLVFLVGLVAVARPGGWRRLAQPLSWVLLVTLLTLVALVAWGVLRGGDFRLSYFQLAALLRLFLLFPVLLAALKSRRDLRWLAATVVAAAFYRAGACLVGHRFFVRNLGPVPWPQYITDHHDSVLWVMVVVGVASWVLLRVRASRMLAAALFCLPLLLAIHYNNRRMAWLELVGGVVLAYMVLPRGRARRRVNRWMVAALPLLVVYCAVGWTRPEAVFAPVRKIKSAVVTDPNDDSNIYRELENASLIVTLQSSRFLGTGFGHPFLEVSDRYAGIAKGWEYYQYMPHNSLLGLAADAGIVGFPLVWAFVPVGAFIAARARMRARRPSEQVLSSVAFCYLFIYGVQAFGDMGLQSLKANVLLACALATATRLAVLTGAWPRRSAEAPEPTTVRSGQGSATGLPETPARSKAA